MCWISATWVSPPALLESAGLTPDQQAQALSLIRRKSAHELEAYLNGQQIAPEAAERIVQMTKLAGPFAADLPRRAEAFRSDTQTARGA